MPVGTGRLIREQQYDGACNTAPLASCILLNMAHAHDCDCRAQVGREAGAEQEERLLAELTACQEQRQQLTPVSMGAGRRGNACAFCVCLPQLLQCCLKKQPAGLLLWWLQPLITGLGQGLTASIISVCTQ